MLALAKAEDCGIVINDNPTVRRSRDKRIGELEKEVRVDIESESGSSHRLCREHVQ
jgi:hypothetical protein